MSAGISAATVFTALAPTVVGGLLGGASSSGTQQGGTQTVNRDPWAPAQDWMKQNLTTGQNLQNYYQKNPFNDQQMSGYGNLASGADYLNRLTPSLLQQFSQPTGFDRNNPQARPNPLNFNAPSVSPQMAQAYGGQMQMSAPSSHMNLNTSQNPFANGGASPMAQAAQIPPQDIQAMIDKALAAKQQSIFPENNNGGGDN